MARRTVQTAAAAPQANKGTAPVAAQGNALAAKFAAIAQAIAGGLIEREAEVALLVTALVAREHVLLVGPPGTAKSMVSDAVADAIGGSRFSCLLTRFTGPDEVFGPVSVVGLKAGRYERITTGKLPEAEIAFIDEIFKASAAILNTLLKILNERQYDSGAGLTLCPLRACLAASNEWPQGEELSALFDRFLFRKTVAPVRTAAGEDRLYFGQVGAPLPGRLTAAEIDQAASEAEALPWGQAAKDAFIGIVRKLAKEGIQPGDRRKRKAVGACRAVAWIAGSPQVEPKHLAVLQHVLWADPAQAQKCAETVLQAADPAQWAVSEATREAEEVIATIPDHATADAQAGSLAIGKLTEIGKRHLERFQGDAAADECRRWLWAEIKAIRARWLDAAINPTF